jgi:phage protein D
MSDSDIVQQIVSGYGVEVQADTTPTVHQENETTIVQRGSDIQFVRELALRNGLEFYFETDHDSGTITAYFRAPQLDGTPQPDLAIQFGDDSNLRSFAAKLTGQRPLAVKIEQIDVTENSANTAQISDAQLTKLGANDAGALVGRPLGSLVTPKDTQAQMLVLGPPTSNATEMQTVARAVRDEASWFITARGEINSDAYQTVLRPHRLVLVKGAGKAYSGKYHVTHVVHELKGDGTYTQSFEARRNARDVDGSEQFGGGGLGLPIPGL